MWFRRFGFKTDPYRPLDPFQIPVDLITWDRDDLEQRDNFFRFVDDAAGGNRVGLRAYGAIGSGKTWLMRYMQKSLVERLGNRVAVLYGKVHRFDPKFSTLYEILVENWNQYRERVLEAVDEEAGEELEGWEQVVEDSDLAACLFTMRHPTKKEKVDICEQWLRGVKVAASDLRTVEMRSPLDSDYRKFRILVKLLNLSLLAFDVCLLIVDELENAPPSLARALGDALREMLDSFSKGFALACAYTAEAGDELLDWGYGEWLFRRMEYEIKLEAIEPDLAPGIFRIHHAAYREQGFEGDELLPFTEPGLRRLINLMRSEFHYPGYIFVNCQKLGQFAAENEVDAIDASLIDEQVSERPKAFQYMATDPRLI